MLINIHIEAVILGAGRCLGYSRLSINVTVFSFFKNTCQLTSQRRSVAMGDPVICTTFTLLLKKVEELEKRVTRKKRMVGCYREGLVKSQEKGLVTLHRLNHCAKVIITKPSKSAFKASRRMGGEKPHKEKAKSKKKGLSTCLSVA